MNILHRIYARLPLVRELKDLKRPDTLQEERNTRALERQVMQMQLAEHVRRLMADPRHASPKRLNRHEWQVFSQTGEDGIIAEIFRRIGTEAKTFVEIGVGDGLENNTAFLLFQGWKGHWVDGDKKSIERIRESFKRPIAEQRLSLAQSFVTAENIAATLGAMHLPGTLDLLSLDIDRNTYWIWKALRDLRPRVVVVEYNASIPADVDWTVDYAADRTWNGSLYFSASLKAYERLGIELGYRLVGCSLSGLNAFFVRTDLCDDRFEAPFTAENHHEPPRYYLYRAGQKPLPSAFSDEP